MKWVKIIDKKPSTPGLYGGKMFATFFLNDFSLFYWDGKGWKAPVESDNELAPYRLGPMLWCVLEFGKG